MRVRLLVALAAGASALLVAAGAQAATATVTLDVAGNGSGKVTSDPAGIDCTVVAGVESGACSATFSVPGDTVTVNLLLKADPGSECRMRDAPESRAECASKTFYPDGFNGFDRWDFVRVPQQLTVSKTGDGSGTVTSSPAGIDCGATCSSAFAYDSKVTLTATPDAGAVFKQWTGACNGQGATCMLTITQATTTNAVFDLAGVTTTPTAPTSPSTDTTVGADVIGAAAGRSRIGKRVVRLELVLDEPVSAVLTLVRKGSKLATKRFASVRDGERVLTLIVPAGVAGGRARLRFVLTDAAGNTLSGRRSVRIQARG
jgi:hypothetical protein